MSRRFSFGELATGIGEIKRAISTAPNGIIVADPGSNISASIQGSFADAAYQNFTEQGDVFLVGFHIWGSNKARVGR